MAIVINGSGTISGLTAQASDVELTDSTKIMLGTGDDLQMYHDAGGHSYIKESGSGHLVLNVDDVQINNAANTANILKGVDGGMVELYHNNASKLQTTATGVTVTGAMGATTLTGDGSALTGIGGGKILQVVEANGTTHTAASNTNNTWTDSVVTAAITPASTSNKIFVCYRLGVHFTDNSGNAGYSLRCKRAISGGATTDSVPALSCWSSGNTHSVFWMITNTGDDWNMMSTATGVDSPSASTAVTYTVGAAGYNIQGAFDVGGQYSGRWSIVLMEIEG